MRNFFFVRDSPDPIAVIGESWERGEKEMGSVDLGHGVANYNPLVTGVLLKGR